MIVISRGEEIGPKLFDMESRSWVMNFYVRYRTDNSQGDGQLCKAAWGASRDSGQLL